MTNRGVPAPEGSPDSGVPWHYGDPHAEQRALGEGVGIVDLSNRDVITVAGSDRLTWLNDLTTQLTSNLQPGASTTALILDPHGHVEHELHLVDDGTQTWIITEPGAGGKVLTYLDSMRFMLRVEVDDRSAEFAVVWLPRRVRDPSHPTWLIADEFAGTGASDAGSDRGGDATKYVGARPGALIGAEVIIPIEQAEALLSEADDADEIAGTWALEALRVGAGVPRVGQDTDHKTLPHEVGWIGPAVHLNKGCYRGQETVARVHNLGRPPRRLTLLHLDGSANLVPAHGDEVLFGDRVVGTVGSVARHFELGPIASAIIKRSVPIDAQLRVKTADGEVAATQETVVLAS